MQLPNPMIFLCVLVLPREGSTQKLVLVILGLSMNEFFSMTQQETLHFFFFLLRLFCTIRVSSKLQKQPEENDVQVLLLMREGNRLFSFTP